MRKLILLSTLLFLFNVSFGQDLLYFANGNFLQITNFRITDDSLAFNIYNSNSEFNYSVNKAELKKLITEDGEVIEFKGMYIKFRDNSMPSNMVSFNVLAVPALRFTMSYQLFNADGTVGYEIPVSIGLAPDAYTDPLPEIFDIEMYSIFYTGFTLNWYPLAQRKVTYVLGPTFRIGVGTEDTYYYDEFSSYYHDYNRQYYYSKLLINNGLVVNPSKHFSMAWILSLGVMHRDGPSDMTKFGTTADFTFNISYKF